MIRPAKTLDAWLKDGDYLPAPLRDFHDQKDVFKTLWRGTAKRIESDTSAKMYLGKLDWVAAQIFTIDHFLHFMAAHGWTLQRSRKRVQFCDLDALVEERKAEDVAAFRKMMEEDAEKRRAAAAELHGTTENDDADSGKAER